VKHQKGRPMRAALFVSVPKVVNFSTSPLSLRGVKVAIKPSQQRAFWPFRALREDDQIA
jgi:hypothetical protein